MKQIIKDRFSIEIKWAFILTLISIFWVLGEKLLGFHDKYIDQHFLTTQFFVLPVIGIYIFALLEKRKREYDNIISYKQCLITGIYVTAYVTMISPLIQFVNLELISPDYFKHAIFYNVTSGFLSQPEAEQYFNLKTFTIQSMTGITVIGITVSVIAAFFIKTA